MNEHLYNDTEWEKPKYSEKIFLSHLVHHKYYVVWSGFEPSPPLFRGRRLVVWALARTSTTVETYELTISKVK
jgi:hypothetical protein